MNFIDEPFKLPFLINVIGIKYSSLPQIKSNYILPTFLKLLLVCVRSVLWTLTGIYDCAKKKCILI